MTDQHDASRSRRSAVPPAPAASPPASIRRRKAILFSWRPSLTGVLHLAAIWVIAATVWGTAHDRTSRDSWRVPLTYSGDALQMLTWLRAASDFEYLPFADRTNSRLGAPYQANWNDYPMYEPIVTFLIGIAARWTDLVTASNIGVLLSFLLSATSFYVCCRLLRWRREWAAAGALLFAFTYYHTGRGLAHLLLTYDYTVPLAVMSTWLLASSKRIRLGGRLFWLCAGTALLLGLGNPYNLSMWLQLLVLGLAVRLLLKRRPADLAVGGVITAVAVAAFLAVNANAIHYQVVHGENQAAVARGYHQLELFALKPIELILPPPEHRVAGWGDISRDYAENSWIKGELFSPYLGVAGLAALAWLTIEFALRLLNVRPVPRRLPSHAPLCSWIMLYSAVGGLNCLLGLLIGLMYFRGSNRYSIFISAIALFFLVSRMSRLARRWNRAASYALAAAVASVGLLDQLPRASGKDFQATANAVRNDQQFCQALEDALPPGAMVFQLPIMNFIDGDPIYRMMPYEHLRPYLWSRHLHLSFGSVQGRTREAWQAEVADLPMNQLVKQLEGFGFAGLYFNRKAYKDRAEENLKALAICGKTQRIEDEAHEQVCVVLNPSASPSRPTTDDRAQIVYKRGWVWEEPHPDGNRHWARDHAFLYYVNDSTQDCVFHLTGMVMGWIDQRMEIRSQAQSFGSRPLHARQALTVDLRFRARPGRNYLYFLSDGDPQPPPGHPEAIRVAFGVVNLKIVREGRNSSAP